MRGRTFAQTVIALGVTAEPYAAGLIRVRIDPGVRGWAFEVTCAPDELEAIRAWATEPPALKHTEPLPVPEHCQEPWGPNYRWTVAANEIYVAWNAAGRPRCDHDDAARVVARCVVIDRHANGNATRLSSTEVIELTALLSGRVSWRGEMALASAIGIHPRDMRDALRRRRMSRGPVERIRLYLAARGTGTNAIPMFVVRGVH